MCSEIYVYVVIVLYSGGSRWRNAGLVYWPGSVIHWWYVQRL